MKKLFSMLMLLLLVVGLTGCTTDLETKITDLESQITALEDAKKVLEQEKTQFISDENAAETTIEELETEVTELETDITELESDITDLQTTIAELQALVFDNVVTFTFQDSYGNIANDTVGYNDDYTGTLFDILNDNFEVGYSTSEYGNYIFSLEDLAPSNGSFISLSKNGVDSMVGIDLMTYEDKDVFKFEIKWWDQTEKSVFDALNLFLDNHVGSYISSSSIDYNVVAGLAAMGRLEEYLTLAEVDAYLATQTPTTITEYYKLIVIIEAIGGDASTYYNAANALATTGAWGATSYSLLAMNAGTHTEDYSAFEANALTYYNTNTPYDAGLDTGGIDLVALSEYSTETGIDTLINGYVDWIKTDQLLSGGIKTRDTEWGLGTENAASMSQVILGLLANGINPNGVDFTQANGSLLTRLLEFQTDTGSFDWVLDDETLEDLNFSTPQAFVAIATYYAYSNSFGAAQNPYNFN